MEKKIFKSIDLLKFLSAFAVICLHTRPFAGTELQYYTDTFFVMAVPFFFCTSSFFFHRKEASLKHYIWRLLQLYIIWFIIELPYVLSKFDFCSLTGMKVFLWSLFFQNTFWASWFLMALMIAMFIVVPINRWGKKKLLYSIGVVCFLLSLFASMYNELIFYLPYGKLINSFLYFISAAQSFILAVPYCIIGIRLVNTNLKLTFGGELSCLFLLIILTIIEAHLCQSIAIRQNASLMIMPVVFMTVYFFLRHEINLPSRIVVFLRKTSILIYLMHSIVQHFLMANAGVGFGLNLMIYTSVITLLLSVLIVYLSKYIKFMKYLY